MSLSGIAVVEHRPQQERRDHAERRPRSGSGRGPTPRRQPVGAKEPEQPRRSSPSTRAVGLSTGLARARRRSQVWAVSRTSMPRNSRRSLGAERSEQLALGPPRSPRGLAFTSRAWPCRGQLDQVPAPVGRVAERERQSPRSSSASSSADEVARLDAQRHRQVPLGDRPLRVEVVQDGELAAISAPLSLRLRPSRHAEARARRKISSPTPESSGRVSGFGLWLSGCPTRVSRSGFM